MAVQGWLPDSSQRLRRRTQPDTNTPLSPLHAEHPWKSAAVTHSSEPAALTGHTGSVLLPFCFSFARFPPNAGQFYFLRGTVLPQESVTLVFTGAGGGEGKSSTVPLGAAR